jgi:hypothetical protein
LGMIAPGFVATELVPEAMRDLGMPVDAFAAITLPTLLAGGGGLCGVPWLHLDGRVSTSFTTPYATPKLGPHPLQACCAPENAHLLLVFAQQSGTVQQRNSPPAAG